MCGKAEEDPSRQMDLAYKTRAGPLSRRRRNAKLALEYLRSHDLAGFAHVLLNLNEFAYLR